MDLADLLVLKHQMDPADQYRLADPVVQLLLHLKDQMDLVDQYRLVDLSDLLLLMDLADL
jgi:hypothetical protein